MKSRRRLVARLALGLLASGCAAGAGPVATGEAEAGLATLALDQRGEIGGVAVTPLRIDEDSRCPTGVQCIQAGTVRLAVRLEESRARRDTVLTLAEPLALDGGRWLTLAAVCPYPRQPGRIDRTAYRFTFALDRDGRGPRPDIACTP